ncbi:MAG: sigma-70 family RNA polymerase sigma factor [Planctomycetota bacterium]
MVNARTPARPISERILLLWEKTGLDSLHRLAMGQVPFPELGSPTGPSLKVDLSDAEFLDWFGTALMDAYQQTGDREALELLFEAHETLFRRRLRFQLRRMGSRLDLEDVLQESMLNVLRYPHRFSVEKADSFRVWVLTILRNTVLKQLRSYSRASRLGSLDAEFGEESPSVLDPRAKTPLRRATDSESAKSVDRAFLLWLTLYHAQFRELSEREQFALAKVEVEHWSYKQVAESLGIRVENLKMVIFRARRKIVRGLTETLATMSVAARDHRRIRSLGA